MSDAPTRLVVQPLSAEAFAAFGEVIAPGSARRAYPINAGTAQRFDDLARIDVAAEAGRPTLGIVHARPRALPFEVRMLERHPLGSQAWIPLAGARYLVVVARDPSSQPVAFLAARGEGVNYARGTWHHPLIALDAAADFLVLDRAGPGDNCDEVALAQRWRIERTP